MDPLHMADAYAMTMLESNSITIKACNKYLENQQVLTASAHQKNSLQEKLSASCLVTVVGDKMGYVVSVNEASGRQQRRFVDIAKKSCTCLYPVEMRMPCRHLIALARFVAYSPLT